MSETFYKNNKMTGTLEENISSISTFEEFEKNYSDEFLDEDERIFGYVRQLLDTYDARAKTTSTNANLDPTYITQLINGNIKNPSRNALISICLALRTSVEEVQYLLKYAGYSPLYVRRKRDVIIWFGFIKQKNITKVNEDLEKRGFELLTDYREKTKKEKR